MDRYVDYDMAKRLVSIGFSEPVHMMYDIDKKNQFMCSKVHESTLPGTLPCPTQQQVVEWFIEKHGLLILVEYDYYSNDKKFQYGCSVVEIGELDPSKEYAVLRHNGDSLFDNRSDTIDRGIDMCIGLVLHRTSEKKFNAHSMEDVFRILDENLYEESKQCLLLYGASHFHSTIGRWIRNTFELWTLDESNPKLYKILFEKGYDHPDDMSNFILEEYIKHLTDLNRVPDEDYVPYEILSKIIRKGFPAMASTEWYGCDDGKKYQETINKNHYPKVTQHQVLKWLMEKHDIFVNISILDEDERQILPDKEKKKFYWSIYQYSTGEIRPYDGCGLTEFEIINDAITLCADVLL